MAPFCGPGLPPDRDPGVNPVPVRRHDAARRKPRFVECYDQPFARVYIDPPYWGYRADYGKGAFAREDFAGTTTILRNL